MFLRTGKTCLVSSPIKKKKYFCFPKVSLISNTYLGSKFLSAHVTVTSAVYRTVFSWVYEVFCGQTAQYFPCSGFAVMIRNSSPVFRIMQCYGFICYIYIFNPPGMYGVLFPIGKAGFPTSLLNSICFLQCLWCHLCHISNVHTCIDMFPDS